MFRSWKSRFRREHKFVYEIRGCKWLFIWAFEGWDEESKSNNRRWVLKWKELVGGWKCGGVSPMLEKGFVEEIKHGNWGMQESLTLSLRQENLQGGWFAERILNLHRRNPNVLIARQITASERAGPFSCCYVLKVYLKKVKIFILN